MKDAVKPFGCFDASAQSEQCFDDRGFDLGSRAELRGSRQVRERGSRVAQLQQELAVGLRDNGIAGDGAPSAVEIA